MIPTLSIAVSVGGSKFRAHAGARVVSSCCAHQAVSLSFCFTCVRKMQAMPFSTALAARARRSASTKA